MLIAAAVILIALAVCAVRFLPRGGEPDVFLYTTEDEFTLLRDLSAGSERATLSGDPCPAVYFSEDGAYVFFFKSDDTEGPVGSLYVASAEDLKKQDPPEPEKISSHVYIYSVWPLEGKKAVFLKETGPAMQLRLYNGTDSIRLADDAGPDLLIRGGYIYFSVYGGDSEDGGSGLYRVPADGSGRPERLGGGFDLLLTPYDSDPLIYTANGEKYSYDASDVYVAKPGEEPRMILENVDLVVSAADVDGSPRVCYLKKEDLEIPLYSLITDGSAREDGERSAPAEKDFITAGGGSGPDTLDRESYEEACALYEKGQERNRIRSVLKDKIYHDTCYNLCLYENGSSVTLAENVSPDVTGSAEDGIYLYRKITNSVEGPIADIEDVYESGLCDDFLWEKLTDYEGRGVTAPFQNVNGKESDLGIADDIGSLTLCVLDSREAVVLSRTNNERMGLTARAYGIGADSLTFKSVIIDDEEGDYLRQDGEDSGAVYFVLYGDGSGVGGDVLRYADGEKTVMVQGADSADIMKDGTVYKIEDTEYNENTEIVEGTLSVTEDGKARRIADEVNLYGITYLEGGRVVYIRDGDLYLWNGSESEQIARDVVRFWAGRSEKPLRIWCS